MGAFFGGVFSPIFNGLDLLGLVLFINRVVVWLFFAISGYHKIILNQRHEQLVDTPEADGIPAVSLFQCFVPWVEFLAGMALVVGTLAPLAAFGILALMTVAILTDGTKRVVEFAPVDTADAFDDVHYLSETTYWFMALFTIMGGPGWYSLHQFIFLSGGGWQPNK